MRTKLLVCNYTDAIIIDIKDNEQSLLSVAHKKKEQQVFMEIFTQLHNQQQCCFIIRSTNLEQRSFLSVRLLLIIYS